jgi:hypothetical protein
MITDFARGCLSIRNLLPSGLVARLSLDQAYPGIAFRKRTRTWFARLMHILPECVHLEKQQDWMAMFAPDTLYLRGKAVRRELRPDRVVQPGETNGRLRPEVSLCRGCLLDLLEPELSGYHGHVVAFEPDAASVSQYFFLAVPDFEAAGLEGHVADAIRRRVEGLAGECSVCARSATWLWLSQREVGSLDHSQRIAESTGALFCSTHGASRLCRALAAVTDANFFYVNAPYGESGAYVWI